MPHSQHAAVQQDVRLTPLRHTPARLDGVLEDIPLDHDHLATGGRCCGRGEAAGEARADNGDADARIRHAIPANLK